MIKVSPAILTNDKHEFERQLAVYSSIAGQVDIDINVTGDGFAGMTTLGSSDIEPLLIDTEIRYGVHLMVSEPLSHIKLFADHDRIGRKIIFYVHQESNYDVVLKDMEIMEMFEVGIAIKAESALQNIEFYKQFPEVQLMTIETGQQGNPFKPEILERITQLRSGGYQGLISVDGSVNLETASLIKKFAIDRVSVGSFLSKSSDPINDYSRMVAALN